MPRLALPDVKERLEALGFNPVASSPAQCDARIRSVLARWAKVIHEAHITIE